jgi:uncharacterized membrane protein YedE/YeeE
MTNMITIDWIAFTPWTSLGGGILIGLATMVLLIGTGRIAGISGIVGGIFTASGWSDAWRWFFWAGLAASMLLYIVLLDSTPPILITDNPLLLISAGILVGFGTRYGSGCTSGHGICGLSRFSKRSMVATACFMGAGFVTVFVMRHLLGVH